MQINKKKYQDLAAFFCTSWQISNKDNQKLQFQNEEWFHKCHVFKLEKFQISSLANGEFHYEHLLSISNLIENNGDNNKFEDFNHLT